MPTNTTILLIRHAEKPATGTDLSVAGQERAQAYVIYFQNYTLNTSSIKLDYLFASADSSNSCRPRLTIEPLAKTLELPIDDKHSDKDYPKVASDLLQHPKYNNSNILICWHHQEILALAAALGVDSKNLPSTSNWPTDWPEHVFGWLLQIEFDSAGTLVNTKTMCINQKLMYDDYRADPPHG